MLGRVTIGGADGEYLRVNKIPPRKFPLFLEWGIDLAHRFEPPVEAVWAVIEVIKGSCVNLPSLARSNGARQLKLAGDEGGSGSTQAPARFQHSPHDLGKGIILRAQAEAATGLG